MGTVFLPHKMSAQGHPADHLEIFARALCDRFNWNLYMAHELDIEKCDTDIIFTIKCPQKTYPPILDDLQTSNDECHIMYIQDLHGGVNLDVKMKWALDRADLILYAYRDAFLKKYAKYEYKAEWLPTFLCPTDRFVTAVRKTKKIITNKCLSLGLSNYNYNPLRFMASKNPSMFTIPVHPGYGANMNRMYDKEGVYIRDKYAELLASYFSVLSDLSRYKYTICKTWEIMGSGALLLIYFA